MPDHVHLLVRLPPTVACKRFHRPGRRSAASHRVNEEVRPSFKLKWQEGYGALTLRQDEVEKVSRYIDDQEAHHRTGRLSDLLERNGKVLTIGEMGGRRSRLKAADRKREKIVVPQPRRETPGLRKRPIAASGGPPGAFSSSKLTWQQLVMLGLAKEKKHKNSGSPFTESLKKRLAARLDANSDDKDGLPAETAS